MVFWIVAAMMVLIAVGALAAAVMRGRVNEEHPAEYDLRVYRDQLREVERDLARGVVNAEDAERVRTEVSRRILAADTQLKQAKAQEGRPKSRGSLPVVAIIIAALLGGAGLLYTEIGAPGYRDFPLEGRISAAREKHRNRPGQAQYEAGLPASPPVTPSPEYAALVERLRTAVAERPDDVEGLQLLATTEARLGNMKAAYEAQAQLIKAKGDAATAHDHSFRANLMITAAQGYVSPEAERELLRALELNPEDKLARYYMGLMLLQNDRPDLTFGTWKKLLEEGPPDAPWIPTIRARITDLAWFAGEDYTLPPPPDTELSGPTAEDMQAAGEMTPEERQEMIRGMVSQLSERLATEGGTPQEWARLIGAYGVLGETDRAAAIWEEAQVVFADQDGALDIVRDGARRAGVAD